MPGMTIRAARCTATARVRRYRTRRRSRSPARPSPFLTIQMSNTHRESTAKNWDTAYVSAALLFCQMVKLKADIRAAAIETGL